jgi:hypothetical protein
MNILVFVLATGSTLCFLWSRRAYRSAKLQASEPRLAKGKGGIFQELNELGLRQDAKRKLRAAGLLAFMAVALYFFK